MPPIAKITREMIIDAGFELVRKYGMGHVNARAISKKLNCSTQPVMYHFQTIEQIKKEIYQKADKYHSSYITDIQGDNPMLSIGLAYIRFAKTEMHLFRLLFQSNEFDGKSIYELIDAKELTPIIKVLSEAANVSITQAKKIFSSLFIFVHGYASMFANNSLEYDEESISKDLERMFTGMIHASKEEL